MNEIESVLQNLDFPFTPEMIAKLTEYRDELAVWNEKINLVSSMDGFVQRHLADCLAPLSVLQSLQPRKIADLGSGAGLPGIPLSIVLPGIEFYLVERSAKKAGFLNSMRALLSLHNVRVLNIPFENLKAAFDVIVFRAFTPLTSDFIGKVRPLVSSDTKIAAYKGKKETLNNELNSISDLIKEPVVEILEVPGLEEQRHLVLFSLK